MGLLREFLYLVLISFSIRTLSDETRKVVAIVDTGLPSDSRITPYLCKGKQVDLTGYGMEDVDGHGTNILGLIAPAINIKTHCLAMIKYWHRGEESDNFLDAALNLKPVIINLSLSGPSFIRSEKEGLLKLLAAGTKVVIAAGNDGLDLSKSCLAYPACYNFKDPNFYVVSSSDHSPNANFGGPVKLLAHGINQCGIFGTCMTGTSQATANATNWLLRQEK